MAPYSFTQDGEQVELELGNGADNNGIGNVVAVIRKGETSDEAGQYTHVFTVSYDDTQAELGRYSYYRCEEAIEPDSTDEACRAYIAAADVEITRDREQLVRNAIASPHDHVVICVDAPTVQLAYKHAKFITTIAPAKYPVVIRIVVIEEDDASVPPEPILNGATSPAQ